jgi:hypothetical protein
MLGHPEIRQSLASYRRQCPRPSRRWPPMSATLLERGPELAENINDAVLEFRSNGDSPGGLARPCP